MTAAHLRPGIAGLPMYDWVEIRPATDALWSAIHTALAARKIPAPAHLTRDMPLRSLWTAPDLVLAQTCGYPFVTELAGNVGLVGTPDYGLPGCPPGWYRSAIVVRADDPRGGLQDFQGATLAINGTDSQSGFQAIMQAVHPIAEGAFFGRLLVSGGHAASIVSVARGMAEIAAIDAVSWRLATAHLPEAQNVRVLAMTSPVPGLPYITAMDPGPVADAVAEGIAALDPAVKVPLGLTGFVRTHPRDYEILARRAAEAAKTSHAHRALIATSSPMG